MYGNERYEGYVVDLIDELSKLLNFQYELIALKEGYPYGSCSPEIGCNGIIGNVTRGEVDLAVVDLTISKCFIKILIIYLIKNVFFFQISCKSSIGS